MRLIDEMVLGVEADLIGQPLPPKISSWIATIDVELIKILNTLANEGFGAWLVGGCVREAWLHGAETSTDVDVATSCPPELVLELFGDKAVATGAEFGTVSIKGGKHVYELTTLRTESLYRDGRHPDVVTWGESLSEDLSRRDFTFNSLAIDLARGLLYDPFCGIEDLEKGVVKAVGDANIRCDEDALRMLRAYRFLSTKNGGLRKMDNQLKSAIRRHLHRLELVAIERKWMELQKILAGHHCGEIFGLMQEDGVLPLIFAESGVIATPLLHMLDDPRLTILQPSQRLALLLLESSPKMLLAQLDALRCSKEWQRKTAFFHHFLAYLPSPNIAELRVFDQVLAGEAEAHLQTQVVLSTLEIRRHNMPVSNFQDAADVYSAWQKMPIRRTPVSCLADGHWLMRKTGVEQGIRLGRLKEWLHRLQIEQDITELEQLEMILSRLPFEHGSEEDWPRISFP